MHLQRLILGALIILASAVALAWLAAPGSADPAIDSEEQEFLRLINEYRAQNGLNPLALNIDLNEASDWFSIDMATDNYFPADHIDNESPPRDPTQRANAYGFPVGAGENIAAGTFRDTGQEAFDAWKASPPHNRNMLTGNYNVIGIARAFGENSLYKWYWTTDFGTLPNLPTPSPTPLPTPTPTPICLRAGGCVTPTPSPSPTPKPSETPGPVETLGPTSTPGPTPPPSAVLDLAGCQANSIGASDDGSSPQVTLPFTINFFGTDYSSLFVNNNGNVTFGGALSTFTPFDLLSTNSVIIAPYFADVDTRASSPVTYGIITYGGRPGFCANWVDVGYYFSHGDKRNSFQLIILDRSDRNPGDFDIIMNYDKVQWEEGDFSGGEGGLSLPNGHPARMGYSNGSDAAFEYPGSNVPGAFLDSNPNGLVHNNRDSIIDGRYQFSVRNGEPPKGGSISGHVYSPSAHPNNAVSDALVELCGPNGGCTTSTTNGLGEYFVSGLIPGGYIVKVFPPNTGPILPAEIGPVNLTKNAELTGQDVVLPVAMPPPPATTISSRGTSGEVPLVFWQEPLALSTTGCPGGSASYTIVKLGQIIASGGMPEGMPGVYNATVPSLWPNHGPARVNITINCPGGGVEMKPFDIYIDPSGVVKTVDGEPIFEAKVTLYRSASPAGPFEIVPFGSPIMSPANRVNPDVTDLDGHFGWDVIAGFYKVRAEKEGCHAPGDPKTLFVETEVLEIPPPVTDIDLRMDCGSPFVSGDADCDGDVDSVDALKVQRHIAALSVSQTEPCPDIGSPDGDVTFADVDCDDAVDTVDSLHIVRHIGGLPVNLPTGCRPIGVLPARIR